MDATSAATIQAEYDARFGQNDDFRRVCEGLIIKLLDDAGYRVHSVTSRVKGRDSLAKKVGMFGKDYKGLRDVTDVVGIRIITHFEDEVDRIGGLIEREFAVDHQRSVDKRRSLEVDRFGYLSLHYVCYLRDERLQLAEYRRCQGLPCEIQIRSILQHAWAEIEHDLGYKAAAGIPTPIRRRFSQLAGLLEIADREFKEIREILADYSNEITARIADSPSTVEIDQVSIRAFIEGNAANTELDSQMAAAFQVTLDEGIDDDIVAMLAEMLKYAGIQSVEQLGGALNEYKPVLVKEAELRNDPAHTGSAIRGVSLFHLFQVLIALKGSSEDLDKAFTKFHVGSPSVEGPIAKKVYSVIRQAAEAVEHDA